MSVFEVLDWDRETKKRPYVASDFECKICGKTADVISNIGYYCNECWENLDRFRASRLKTASQLDRERLERIRRRTM